MNQIMVKKTVTVKKARPVYVGDTITTHYGNVYQVVELNAPTAKGSIFAILTSDGKVCPHDLGFFQTLRLKSVTPGAVRGSYVCQADPEDATIEQTVPAEPGMKVRYTSGGSVFTIMRAIFGAGHEDHRGLLMVDATTNEVYLLSKNANASLVVVE